MKTKPHWKAPAVQRRTLIDVMRNAIDAAYVAARKVRRGRINGQPVVVLFETADRYRITVESACMVHGRMLRPGVPALVPKRFVEVGS